MHHVPAADGARDGDTVDAVGGHPFNAFAGEKFGGQSLWSRAGTVQSDELAGFGILVNHKQVAAQAGHQGFGYREHGVGGNGGVHRRATLSQDLRAGLRSQHLARGDDSLLADHIGAAITPALRPKGR
jgi:hypothetical protein